jgi:hypothetical protein
MSVWSAALSLLIGLGGWAGLAYLILVYPPSVATQMIFFLLFFIAVTSTAVPVVLVLYRVVPALAERRHSRGTILRQSVWIGLFASGVMGLQAARLRDPMLMVILGVVLILLETYCQQRGW